MKIFDEREIHNIGNEKAWHFIGKRLAPSNLTSFFGQGVEFAESKFKDLAVEYGIWLAENADYGYDGWAGDNGENDEDLFDKWLEHKTK